MDKTGRRIAHALTCPVSFALALLAMTWLAPMLRAQTDAEALLVPNRGQIVDDLGRPCPEILYVAQTKGVRAYVSRTGISIVLFRIISDSVHDQPITNVRNSLSPNSESHVAGVWGPNRGTILGHRVDLRFNGAIVDGECRGLDSSVDHVNIVRGPYGVVQRLPRYRSIVLRELWRGVDLVLRADGVGLKYDLIVQPGGDPRTISISYVGGTGVEPTDDGGILVRTTLGDLRDPAPLVFQTGPAPDTSVKHVASRFVLRGGRTNDVGFDIADYDESRPLVIDPSIIWSTYYGGSGYDYWFDYGGGYGSTYGWSGAGQGMAVDPRGNIYISGGTVSPDFPTSVGSFQRSLAGELDAYIVSLDAFGRRRWSTLLGGGQTDYCSGIHVSDEGVLAASGSTRSIDFPTSDGAFQSTNRGDYDAFAVRLDTSGVMIWSTYLGGSDWDFGGSVSVDHDGSVVVAGSTQGVDFPITSNAFQSRFGGVTDAFIARFDSNGRRVWATFVGGSAHDFGSALALDAGGAIAATIQTYSHDFPTSPGAFRRSWSPQSGDQTEGAIVLLGPDGRVRWSTYFGGSANDWINNPSFDGKGFLYVCGSTISADLPTTALSLQRRIASGSMQVDTWITRLTSAGLVSWTTYYGGSDLDFATALSTSPNGHVYVTGYTRSPDLTRADSTLQSLLRGGVDAFVLEVDSLGRMVWDTYLGGTSDDVATGVTGDGSGSIYLSGYTRSRDFPTLDPFQAHLDTSSGLPAFYCDAFLARLCGRLYPIVSVDGPQSFCEGGGTRLNGPPGYTRYLWTPTNDTSASITARASGDYKLHVWGREGCQGVSRTVPIQVHPLPRPTILVDGPKGFCDGDSVVLRAYAPGAISYRWTDGRTTASIVVRSSGSFAVEAVDAYGCTGVSGAVSVVRYDLPPPPRIGPGPTLRQCHGERTPLFVGRGYARVEWSTGQTGDTIQVAPGRYHARVFNSNGCWVESDTVEVIEYHRSTVTIAPSGPVTICSDDSLLLDAGHGFISYMWSNGWTGRSQWARQAGHYWVVATDTNGCRIVSDTMKVGVHRTPDVSIRAPAGTHLCAGDTATLELAPGGFTDVIWNTGQRGSRIRVVEAGTYAARVVTPDGCRAWSPPIDITISPGPSLDPAGPTAICAGTRGHYSVMKRPGVAYRWSLVGDGRIETSVDSSSVVVSWGGADSADLRVDAIDTLFGCRSSAVLSITIGSTLRPRIGMSDSVSCDGEPVTLDAGGGYVDYVWSTGERTRTIRAGAGLYSVNVRALDGCEGTSAPVSIDSGRTPLPTVSPGGTIECCPGDSILLDAGAGYMGYLWSDGSRHRYLWAHRPGAYSVSVIDRNGCAGHSVPAHVLFHQRPSAFIIGPVVVCSGAPAAYSVPHRSDVRYVWSVSGGVIVGPVDSHVVSVDWRGTTGGSVMVRISGRDGCIATGDAIDVRVGDTALARIGPGLKPHLCTGSSLVLDAGPGYQQYVWSTGETTPAISVDRAGRYAVSIVDESGCHGSSGSIDVVEVAPPTPTITASGPGIIRRGEPLVLDAGDGFVDYLWSTGAGTQRIVVRDEGVYGVHVTDDNGCSAVAPPFHVVRGHDSRDSADFRIVVGSGHASPGEKVQITLRLVGRDPSTMGGVRLTGGLRFNRTLLVPCDSTPVGQLLEKDRVVPISVDLDLPEGEDLLTLAFIAAIGNEASTPLLLEGAAISGLDLAVGIDPGLFTLSDLCVDQGERLVSDIGAMSLRSVRPNPVAGLIEVDYDLVEDRLATLVLVDILGRPVFPVVELSGGAGSHRASLDLHDLPPGAYQLVLRSGAGRVATMIIVER